MFLCRQIVAAAATGELLRCKFTLQYLRIEVAGEIGGIRVRIGGELIVNADFGGPAALDCIADSQCKVALTLRPSGASPPFVAGS
jgi:hypothetical protein